MEKWGEKKKWQAYKKKLSTESEQYRKLSP